MKTKKMILIFAIGALSFVSCTSKINLAGNRYSDFYEPGIAKIAVEFYEDSCFMIYFTNYGHVGNCDSTAAFGKYKVKKNEILFQTLLKCPRFNSYTVKEYYLPGNDSTNVPTFDFRHLDGSPKQDRDMWYIEFNGDTNSLCLYDIKDRELCPVVDSLWFQKNKAGIYKINLAFLGEGEEYICKNNKSNHFEITVPDQDYWYLGFPSSAARMYVYDKNTLIYCVKERKKRLHNWQLWLKLLSGKRLNLLKKENRTSKMNNTSQ